MTILSPAGRRIQVHGHRGARALRPENTLAAFEYAISVGADALEMDVVVTRDDVVVVSHEPILDRPIRELPAEEVTAWRYPRRPLRRFPRQLQTPDPRIPTLDQVLALAPRGGFLFNIEIKSFPKRPRLTPSPEHFSELVLRLIRAHRLQPRVMVQSFDFRILHAMRRLAPEIRLAALYVGRPKSLVAIARQAGTEIVAPYHALATARRVRAAHAAGLQVIPWTANQPRQWKRLIAARVDGIITDDPGSLIQRLSQVGLR